MSAWLELTLAGPKDALEALLRSSPAPAVTDRALDLWEESLGERILEAVHLDQRHRVYLPETEVPELLDRLGEHPSLRLQGRRRALRGHFAFHGETPSREAAARIRAVLHAPPPEGVVLRNVAESEEIDPEAQGAHLYDRAAHGFVYSVKGEAEGAVPGVFELHRRLRDLDFVHPEPLRLAGEPAEA